MNSKLDELFDNMSDEEIIAISEYIPDCGIDRQTARRIRASVLEKSGFRREQRTRTIMRRLATSAACLALVIALTVIANAASGGVLFNAVRTTLGNNKVEISGLDLKYIRGEDEDDSQDAANWLVEERDGKLIFSYKKHDIDITQMLEKNGYYYYSYTDEAGILHRFYIVRNNGEAGTERWYSQVELIILWEGEKVSISGIGKSSGGMIHAIGYAEYEFIQGAGSLDDLVRKYLNDYWEGTGIYA